MGDICADEARVCHVFSQQIHSLLWHGALQIAHLVSNKLHVEIHAAEFLDSLFPVQIPHHRLSVLH